MARKKHLINVHTSTGTTAPTGASLYLGEIAVQHTPDNPALWIKMGTGETSTDYEKFIGETEILNILNTNDTLGSGYTYSGIPYVNSSTTIADAYSALTNEFLEDEEAISAALNDLNARIAGIPDCSAGLDWLSGKVETDEFVISHALNDLNSRVNEISGSSGGGADVAPLSAAVITLSSSVVSNEYVTSLALNDLDSRIDVLSGNTGGNVGPVSAAVISLSAAVITISGNAGGDYTELSSATHTHVTNNDIHVTTSDKTAWNNNTTAITALSAATTAHTSNSNIHVPTGGTDGQFLSLVNGSPAWTTPITVYSGANPPQQSLGNNGDIYLQTS